MASSVREKVRLVSSAKNSKGKPTGTIYTTEKNKRNTPDKLVIKKFDPRAYNETTGKSGMMVEFKENNKWK